MYAILLDLLHDSDIHTAAAVITVVGVVDLNEELDTDIRS